MKRTPGRVGHVDLGAGQELGDEGRADPQAAGAAQRLQARHPALRTIVTQLSCGATSRALQQAMHAVPAGCKR